MDWTYDAKVLKVVDGDTVDLELDLGFKILHRARTRLFGINTPEISSKDEAESKAGILAREFLKGLCEGKPCTVVTQKDKGDKYGRYLVTLKLGELDVNAELIRLGHAKAYFGGAR